MGNSKATKKMMTQKHRRENAKRTKGHPVSIFEQTRGLLKGIIKEDPVVIERKLRRE